MVFQGMRCLFLNPTDGQLYVKLRDDPAVQIQPRCDRGGAIAPHAGRDRACGRAACTQRAPPINRAGRLASDPPPTTGAVPPSSATAQGTTVQAEQGDPVPPQSPASESQNDAARRCSRPTRCATFGLNRADNHSVENRSR